MCTRVSVRAREKNKTSREGERGREADREGEQEREREREGEKERERERERERRGSFRKRSSVDRFAFRVVRPSCLSPVSFLSLSLSLSIPPPPPLSLFLSVSLSPSRSVSHSPILPSLTLYLRPFQLSGQADLKAHDFLYRSFKLFEGIYIHVFSLEPRTLNTSFYVHEACIKMSSNQIVI